MLSQKRKGNNWNSTMRGSPAALAHGELVEAVREDPLQHRVAIEPDEQVAHPIDPLDDATLAFLHEHAGLCVRHEGLRHHDAHARLEPADAGVDAFCDLRAFLLASARLRGARKLVDDKP